MPQTEAKSESCQHSRDGGGMAKESTGTADTLSHASPAAADPPQAPRAGMRREAAAPAAGQPGGRGAGESRACSHPRQLHEKSEKIL